MPLELVGVLLGDERTDSAAGEHDDHDEQGRDTARQSEDGTSWARSRIGRVRQIPW